MLNLRIFGGTDRAPGRGGIPAARLTAVPDTAMPGPAAVADGAALDDFIYLISHDLRASMRALLEVPVWIREDMEASGMHVPEGVREHMSMLERHTSRLDRMLHDLLAYSRIGRMQSETEVEVGAILDQVLDETPLPDGWTLHRQIAIDRLRIGERDALTLLQALLSNCVKHHDAEAGTITVALSAEAGDVFLDVTDDGPGIDPAHRDTVFEIMRTLRPRDQVEGSGMGLALVRKIAAVHGGSVEIRDPVASGSRGVSVRVRLPRGIDADGRSARAEGAG